MHLGFYFREKTTGIYVNDGEFTHIGSFVF